MSSKLWISDRLFPLLPLFDVVPALRYPLDLIVFILFIALLVTGILRPKPILFLVAFGLLGSILWSLSYAPAWLLATVAPAPDRLVSDLVTSVPSAATFVQRTAVAVAGVGLLVFAAACLRRPDAVSTARYVIVGAVFLGGSAVG